MNELQMKKYIKDNIDYLERTEQIDTLTVLAAQEGVNMKKLLIDCKMGSNMDLDLLSPELIQMFYNMVNSKIKRI